jgi:hypothetical protein
VPSGNSVPPTTTVGGLNATRADVVLAPQARRGSQQEADSKARVVQ